MNETPENPPEGPKTPVLSRGAGHAIFWTCLFAPAALAAIIFSLVHDMDESPAPFFLWALVALGCSFASAFLLGSQWKRSMVGRVILTGGTFVGLFVLNLILFVIGCASVNPLDLH